MHETTFPNRDSQSCPGQTRPGFFSSLSLILARPARPDWEMEPEEALGYLDRFTRLPERPGADGRTWRPPAGLHLLGGEPFARVDALERLVDTALRGGMFVEAATRAGWATDDATTRAVLRRFSGKLRLLSVYTQASALRGGAMAALRRTLAISREVDLDAIVVCAVGPGSPLPRELFALEEVNCDTTMIRVDPLLPTIGQTLGEEYEPFLLPQPPRHRRCAELMTCAVVAGGDVFPCISGIATSTLRLGNLRRESLETILERVSVDAGLGRLRQEGPFFLYRACCDAGRDDLLPRGFVNPCHFHLHALDDPALAAVVAAAG